MMPFDPMAAGAALAASDPLAQRVQATVASILAGLPAGHTHPTIVLALQHLAANPTHNGVRAAIAQLRGATSQPRAAQLAMSVATQLAPLLSGPHGHLAPPGGMPPSAPSGAGAYGAPEISGVTPGPLPPYQGGVNLPPGFTPRGQTLANAARAQLAVLPPSHPIIAQVLQGLLDNPTDKGLRLAIYELQGASKTLSPTDKSLALQVSQALMPLLKGPIHGVITAG